VFMAAHNGYDKALTVLATNGANLNTTYNGATPAFIAAQNGHDKALTVLATNNADLNTTNNGMTPAFMAAKNGHDKALTVLATNDADLNTTSNGITPAFIAAENGHDNALTVLVKKGADIHKAYHSDAVALKKFAQEKDIAIRRRMGDFIQSQLSCGVSKSRIALTPKQIATIMGHDAILYILELRDSLDQSRSTGKRIRRTEPSQIDRINRP
ncbi:MAG: ankyrin repeat domain-containing protein, partial [Legionellales bacterium]